MLALILVLAMAMPVFAANDITQSGTGDIVNSGNGTVSGNTITGGAGVGGNITNTATGGAGGAGGSATATNGSVTDNSKTYNTNTNVNTNVQSQQQQQQQHQSSVNVNKNTSISDANARSSSFNAGNEQTINQAPNYLQAQPIYPYLLQIVPGVVGNMTKDTPNVGILPLGNEEVIKIASYTRGGRIAGFSRLEDYDSDILDLKPGVMKDWGQKTTEKIRISILFKMSSKTIGGNLGLGGSGAGFGGGGQANPVAWGTNGSGIGSFAVNTADPKIIIKFYLIK